ncbi:MAG: DUF4366 domain-containing protein [Eubacterium sp.]|nr:DUF4366 domain-containing protein [Eubacterium sp.]
MKMLKRLILSLSVMTFLFTSFEPTYAYVDESKVQEESEAQQAEEDPKEPANDDSMKEADSKEESEPEKESGVLTPEGELDLVDDLTGEETRDLQYMTVQTKDGTVFYLIIDHSSRSDNVYFLNQVDASDLLAIMNDEEIDAYEESLKEKEEEATKREPEKVIEPEKEQEESSASDQNEKKDEKNEKKGSAVPLMAVLGVIAAGVLGGYYFFKIRPERSGAKIDRMEFEDDEYIDDGPVEPDE